MSTAVTTRQVNIYLHRVAAIVEKLRAVLASTAQLLVAGAVIRIRLASESAGMAATRKTCTYFKVS